jgi:hypothetical protein
MRRDHRPNDEEDWYVQINCANLAELAASATSEDVHALSLRYGGRHDGTASRRAGRGQSRLVGIHRLLGAPHAHMGPHQCAGVDEGASLDT